MEEQKIAEFMNMGMNLADFGRALGRDPSMEIENFHESSDDQISLCISLAMIMLIQHNEGIPHGAVMSMKQKGESKFHLADGFFFRMEKQAKWLRLRKEPCGIEKSKDLLEMIVGSDFSVVWEEESGRKKYQFSYDEIKECHSSGDVDSWQNYCSILIKLKNGDEIALLK